MYCNIARCIKRQNFQIEWKWMNEWKAAPFFGVLYLCKKPILFHFPCIMFVSQHNLHIKIYDIQLRGKLMDFFCFKSHHNTHIDWILTLTLGWFFRIEESRLAVLFDLLVYTKIFFSVVSVWFGWFLIKKRFIVFDRRLKLTQNWIIKWGFLMSNLMLIEFFFKVFFLFVSHFFGVVKSIFFLWKFDFWTGN